MFNQFDFAERKVVAPQLIKDINRQICLELTDLADEFPGTEIYLVGVCSGVVKSTEVFAFEAATGEISETYELRVSILLTKPMPSRKGVRNEGN